jgi:hypothetical protein
MHPGMAHLILEAKTAAASPQVPLLNQSSPQTAVHLVMDSVSNRTLPDSMLLFAVPRGTQEPYISKPWGWTIGMHRPSSRQAPNTYLYPMKADMAACSWS